MTTILITFAVALILSLVLTPLADRLGAGFGAMDYWLMWVSFHIPLDNVT